MPRMRQILYSSLAVRPFSEEELRDMCERFGERNAKIGVTGLMSYQGNCFTQVIEGEEERLSRLFDRIRVDDRHKYVFVLIDRVIDEPEFPDWSMVFADEDKLQKVDLDLFEARRSEQAANRESGREPGEEPPNAGLAYRMMVSLRDELRRIGSPGPGKPRPRR